MRKTIPESQDQLLSELRKLSPKDRDAFVRAVLRVARHDALTRRFEPAAIALDSLCFSIDGTTEV